MKTIPLEEAIRLASPLPWTAWVGDPKVSRPVIDATNDGSKYDPSFTISVIDDLGYDGLYMIDGKNDVPLIAHCVTHFPEVVEALKLSAKTLRTLEQHLSMSVGDSSVAGKCEAIIAKATQVQLPD